jgi:hypothetical protein
MSERPDITSQTAQAVAGLPLAVSGLLRSVLLATVVVGPAVVAAADGLPAGQADSWEVVTRLAANGSLRAAVAAPLPADAGAAEATVPTLEVVEHAVAADATLRYIERPADQMLAEVAGPTVARRYIQAEAVLQVDAATVRTTLPPDARAVLITAAEGRLHPWLVDGFVTREERDLLTVPFDTAWQDALRPPPAAAAGTTWRLATDGLAAVLCIDTVTAGEVTATVKRVDEDLLTVSLVGNISGGVDGAPTTLELSGSYCWDASRLTGGGLARLDANLHERRQAGHISPGLDIEATVEMIRRRPLTGSVSQEPPTQDQAVSGRPRRGPGRPGSLWLNDPHSRFDLVHDARWRAIEQQPDQTVLRLIDEGRLLGQVSIIPLPPAGDTPSLAAFQRDIERSLSGQFNHLVAAAESQRSDGTRILRVASDGEADGLPFRWVHYHVAAVNGGRATLSFMVESGQLEQFGEADQRLVDGFAVAGEWTDR